MAQHKDKGSTEEVRNGFAKDVERTAARASETLSSHPVLQGYLILAAGIILLLFSLGFLTTLKWAIVFAAVALIVWGTVKSNLVERTSNLIRKLRSR